MTFGAWSMGHFGPLAFPGGLARARQHVWLWEAGRTVPEGHRGFIRIRMSYVFGTGQDARVLPENYQPLAEMMFLSRVVRALLNMSSVLCYFNPNGEVLARWRGIPGYLGRMRKTTENSAAFMDEHSPFQSQRAIRAHG